MSRVFKNVSQFAFSTKQFIDIRMEWEIVIKYDTQVASWACFGKIRTVAITITLSVFVHG